MIKKLLTLIAFIPVSALIAQCPTSSTPTKNCSSGDKIEAFTLNSIAATGNSGCGSGGFSTSSQSWTLNVGQTYSYTSVTGQSAGLPDAFAIFIDLNGDNQYSSTEMLITDPLAYTHSGTISIPSGIGTYTIGVPLKMRIIGNASPITNAMACTGGSNLYGEVEDYIVYLGCPTLTTSISGPANLCSGNSSTLSLTGAGNSYTWSPGGQLTPTIAITTTATAVSTVTYAIATQLAGCAATYTAAISIAVGPTPTVSISGITTICPSASSTVALTASGATTYSWSTGSAIATVTVGPSSTTTYTVVGTTGFCTQNKTVTVVKTTPLTPAVSGPTLLCSGIPAVLTVTGGGDSYTWTPGGIVVTPTLGIVNSATVLGTTSYSLITSFIGCPETATVAFTQTVAPSPTVTLSGPTLICPASSPTVNLTASGAASYLWSGGYTTSSVAYNPTVTTAYNVVGTTGLCSSTNLFTVTVSANPTVTISGPSSLCSGAIGTLTASGAVTYTWIPGSMTGSTAVISQTAATNYIAIGTNSAGCSASSPPFNVALATSISPTITGNPAICGVASGTVNLAAIGASSYTWSSGALTSTVALSPASTTNYTLYAKAGVCTSTQTFVVYVSPNPTVTASSSTPSVICAGKTVTLTASGASAFAWNNAAMTSSIVVTPTITTTYTIIGTTAGCSAQATITQTVSTCAGIEEINAAIISVYPNPTNHVINISIPEDLIGKAAIEIYDALGKLMIKEVLTNQTNTINTSKLSDGVYIYKVNNNSIDIKVGRLIKN